MYLFLNIYYICTFANITIVAGPTAMSVLFCVNKDIIYIISKPGTFYRIVYYLDKDCIIPKKYINAFSVLFKSSICLPYRCV